MGRSAHGEGRFISDTNVIPIQYVDNNGIKTNKYPCNPNGSDGSNCDLHTGQCKCKPTFKGLRCDQGKCKIICVFHFEYCYKYIVVLQHWFHFNC